MPNMVELLPRNPDLSQANAASRSASVSADGRYVAFESDASNLAAGDTADYADVYLLDRLTGEITWISEPAMAPNPLIGAWDGNNVGSAISADGAYVAFVSCSGTLAGLAAPDIPADANIMADVYVYEVATGDLTRLTNQGVELGIIWGAPSISDDGRYVAFTYRDTMAPPGPGGFIWYGISVIDRQSGVRETVTIGLDDLPPDGMSMEPSISGDGRYVTFLSMATNLIPDDTGGFADVFLADRQTDTIVRVSQAADGTEGNYGGGAGPAISADGAFVAFQSSSTNLVPGQTIGGTNIYVYEVATGAVELISASAGGDPADWNCETPAISSDGRYVAFVSGAENLVAGDTNEDDDIFRVDRQTGAIERVSVTDAGAQVEGDSSEPTVSGSGSIVVYRSLSADLVAGDANAVQDIFLADMGDGAPSGDPDLTVTVDSYASGIYHPSDTVTPTLELANVGDEAALGGWDVQVILSINQIVGDVDDLILGSWTEAAGLAAGASRLAVQPMAIPGDAPMGRYHVIAWIDPTDVIDEGAGELNNDGWSVDAGVVLVPEGYVMPVVTEVTSSRDPEDPHFQDPMRYIAGLGIPAVHTTFTAEVSGAPTSVSFRVGGITVVDDNGGDGWSATINMSEVASPGPVVVVADGVSDPGLFDVNVLMLPEWFQEDHIKYEASFDEDRGYIFQMQVRDVVYGVTTPDDWSFSDPAFDMELVDLASEWTGFWCGSKFELVSDIEGHVTPGPIHYGINVTVLGWVLYDRFVEMSENHEFGDGDDEGYGDADESNDQGEASEGSFQGTLTGDIIYSFTDNLGWQGAAGRVTLGISYDREFDFYSQYIVLAQIAGLPVLTASIGAGMSIDVAVSASLAAQLDADNIISVTDVDVSAGGTVTPSMYVGIEALYGLVGKARISLGAAMQQDIEFGWDGDLGFDIQAPGALDINARLTGSLLCGLFKWSKDWNWRVLSWDFFGNTGDDVAFTETDHLAVESYVDVDLADDGHGNVIAVYVWDDPDDPSGHRQDLQVEFRDPVSGAWQGPSFLTQTAQMEAAPAVAYDASGTPFVVFVQSAQAFDAIDLEDLAGFAAGQNLQWARYDDGADEWVVAPLVTDSQLHGNPDIAFSPIAADGAIAWETGSPSANLVDPTSMEILVSRWNGATWSLPQAVTNNGVADWGVQTLYRTTGEPLVTWITDSDGDVTTAGEPTTGLDYAVWNDGTSSWNVGSIVADGLSNNQHLRMAAMPDGSVEAYWVRHEAPGRFSLMQAAYDGTAWSAPTAILANWMFIDEPAVTVDDDGQVCVLFTGMKNHELGVYRIDHASPWSLPTLVTPAGEAPLFLASAVDESGEVVVGMIPDPGMNPGQVGQVMRLGLPPASDGVVARHVFYHNSPMGDAIDEDKQPLLPGEISSAANRTTYALGLNGLAIDIDQAAGAPETSDFVLRVGNSPDPSAWTEAPAPSSMAIAPGMGKDGSDRITLTWADGAIVGQWLEVTVLADANGGSLGLGRDDIFYFGNLPGDADGDRVVGASDYIALKRSFGSNVVTPGALTDFDGSGTVDFCDLRALQSSIGQSLNWAFTAPGQGTAAASAMVQLTDATHDAAAVPLGSVTDDSPPAYSATEEDAAAAAIPGLQVDAGVLDALAHSTTLRRMPARSFLTRPPYATKRDILSGRIGPMPAPTLSPLGVGNVGQEDARLLHSAKYWPDDSTDRESPREPSVIASALDVSAKLREDRLRPVVVDVLAATT